MAVDFRLPKEMVSASGSLPDFLTEINCLQSATETSRLKSHGGLKAIEDFSCASKPVGRIIHRCRINLTHIEGS